MNKVSCIKNKNYTTISNSIFREKNLSLKAKGLLALVLTLPNDWDFTIDGIASIIKEGKTAIYSAIDELKTQGYCHVETLRNEKGVFIGNDYTFFETPYIENPHLENPNMDNQPQQSKDIELSTDKQSKDKEKEDKSSKKEAKIESDEDEFVEKIYSLYPAKCPKRNMSLGKTYKDKERIHKLLRTYSREDIERVVKQEVNEKYGKCYMSNFSTFLNNFPDPNSLFGKEQENTSNTGGEEDMMQKFLDLPDSEQAKILQLDAYQYHMLPASAKEGWMNNRKQFILQWFTENGQ